MARLDVEISDELAGWIQDEVKKSKGTKVAFVTAILEAARKGPDPGPAGNDPDPAREPPGNPGNDPDRLRKMAVTLEFFFKRYLFDHPARPDATDEDEEALEERWKLMTDFIDAELAK
jgi:hypothetical protein